MTEQPRRTKVRKKGKKSYTILLVIFILAFFVSLGLLLYQLYDYYAASKITNEIKQIKNVPPTKEEIEQLPEDAESDHLAALFAKYPDFRGWISIDETRVDNPVVQGKNNEFYLRRSMDKEYLRLGTVFADYSNTFGEEGLSDNTILYGHHSNDGSYFRDLIKYKDPEFYKKSHFVTFDTMYETKQWVIISAFMQNLHPDQGTIFKYYNYVDLKGDDFNAFMSEITKRSYVHTDVDVNQNDKFLTLSTCDYEFDDGRFVVVARQLREGESPETMQINSWANENVYMPKAWYETKGKKVPNR